MTLGKGSTFPAPHPERLWLTVHHPEVTLGATHRLPIALSASAASLWYFYSMMNIIFHVKMMIVLVWNAARFDCREQPVWYNNHY